MNSNLGWSASFIPDGVKTPLPRAVQKHVQVRGFLVIKLIRLVLGRIGVSSSPQRFRIGDLPQPPRPHQFQNYRQCHFGNILVTKKKIEVVLSLALGILTTHKTDFRRKCAPK